MLVAERALKWSHARGRRHRTRDRDGRIVRRTITSLAFKGEHSPLGVTATWVVSEAVDRAVTVLEQLHTASATCLFSPLPGSSGFRDTLRSAASSTTNKTLNAFAGWINDHCAAHGRPDGIPLVRKQRWLLSTSQFRRSLAWHIAHQPFGVVAGARQYHHAKVTMFEGYAGTSASGFAAGFAAEEAVAMLDYVEDLYRVEHRRPVRRWGHRADQRRVPPHPTRTGRPGRRRVRRTPATDDVAKPDQDVASGVLNDCFFNAATAVCVKRAKVVGQSVPQHNMCLACSGVRRRCCDHRSAGGGTSALLPRRAVTVRLRSGFVTSPCIRPTVPPVGGRHPKTATVSPDRCVTAGRHPRGVRRNPDTDDGPPVFLRSGVRTSE